MDRDRSALDELPSLLSKSRISTATFEHEIRFDTRNNEEVHNYALAAAQAEHEKVREAARQTFELHKLREAHSQLQHQTLQEQERFRIETARLEEEARLREIQRQNEHILRNRPKSQSPPPARTPSPEASPRRSPPPSHQPAPPAAKPLAAGPPPVAQVQPAEIEISNPLQPVTTNSSTFSIPPAQPLVNNSKTFEAPRPQPIKQLPTVLGSTTESRQHVQNAKPQPTSRRPAQPSHILPDVERYCEIHKNLKNLRKFIVDAGKQDTSFKKKTGEMRRGIRQAVGQLTGERGANKQPMKKIVDLLKESLTSIPSPGVDPSNVTVSKLEAVEGAANNGDKLPVLFIYLLNIFAKAVVSQFVDEAGVSPKAADPIGVVAVSIFSQAEFCWRNKPLIAILIAKIRIACPVVFGIRGNEKTEEGRARLGWKKSEDGEWVPEQVHNTRMTGLGAGYAAICLRDFSKSKMTNPWPPTHYWQAIASIVSTSPDQTSSTQYIVLRALIDGCEAKFMNFYGSAARAALQVALVEFPGRALERTVAVSSLEVLADKLKRDVGLQLRR